MSTAELRTQPLRITSRPDGYRPHGAHQSERIWTLTNCYMDLWIELLHALGHDPVPAFAATLSTGFDGQQWTFLKPWPEDLRRLYGLEVAEVNLWRPPIDIAISGLDRGVLHTIEVDSWYLPDTAGIDYRTGHVKSTIVPTMIDRDARVLHYLHNGGLYLLQDDDFDGVFNLRPDLPEGLLPPYTEAIRSIPEHSQPDVLPTIVREHLDRRPDCNPLAALGAGVRSALDWIGDGGLELFHQWTFGSLRQCGATAELAADLAECLERDAAGAAAAAPHFRKVAEGAKSVQFKMARAARGRSIAVDDILDEMTEEWQSAVDAISAAV